MWGLRNSIEAGGYCGRGACVTPPPAVPLPAAPPAPQPEMRLARDSRHRAGVSISASTFKASSTPVFPTVDPTVVVVIGCGAGAARDSRGHRGVTRRCRLLPPAPAPSSARRAPQPAPTTARSRTAPLLRRRLRCRVRRDRNARDRCAGFDPDGECARNRVIAGNDGPRADRRHAHAGNAGRGHGGRRTGAGESGSAGFRRLHRCIWPRPRRRLRLLRVAAGRGSRRGAADPRSVRRSVRAMNVAAAAKSGRRSIAARCRARLRPSNRRAWISTAATWTSTT